MAQAARLLRPGGQFIFTHEPLIEGHPDYGRAQFTTDVTRYRRPTQAVMTLTRKGGLKLRTIKDLVAGHRLGEPVIYQLVRLERR
jgi:predicted TPR repeat methyltransferase